MKEDTNEIISLLDKIIIETALNTAHLQTLTIAFEEVSAYLLTKEEAKNLKGNYYHTLLEKTSELLNAPDLLRNHAKSQMALFELTSFVNHQLKDL